MGRGYIHQITSESVRDVCSDEISNRQKEWDAEKEKYGFDSRETWNLDKSMVEILYERLKMYDEVANIDTHACIVSIEIEDKELTLQEIIDNMLELGEYLITNEDVSYGIGSDAKAYRDKSKRFWYLWYEIFPFMWW